MAGRGFYINFKVPELQKALNNISKYDEKTALKIEQQVRKSTKAIKNGAVKRIHDETGYLKTHTVDTFDKRSITGAVRAKAPHAHLVEFGAGETTVTRSKKKALTINKLGTIAFAKQAHIPKRNERPYMRPAYEDEKPNMIKGLSEAVKHD